MTASKHASARLQRIRVSPTIAISTKAKELKAAGQDIINLSTGEPDFDTPEHIKEAARRALADGETKYTAVPGTLEAREAVCRKLSRDNGLSCQPDQIVITNGAKHAIMNLLQTTIDHGDEVVILAPCWVSYPDIVNFCGGVPVSISASAADNYKVGPEQLREALTPKSRMVMLNSPSNPTGAVYSATELVELGKVLADFPDVLICVDDIYEHIVYDVAGPATSMATACPDLLERIVIINGVSKAYAMTGWRLGFSASTAVLAKGMAKIQSQTTSNVNSIAQAAAIAAFDSNLDCLQPMLAAFSARRAKVIDSFSSIDGLVLPPIAGAFYAFPQAREAIDRLHAAGKLPTADDTALVAYLLDKGVAAVPGSAFEGPGAFRISFAAEDSLIDKALDRISAALA